MSSKRFFEEGSTILRTFSITGFLAILLLGLTMCAQPAGAPAEAPAEQAEAPAEEAEAPAEEAAPAEEMPEESAAPEDIVLAIEHFSVIEGTTWSGAHDRAGKRLAEKYDNVEYVFREEVGPDLTVPYAEEMISSDGATIVIGNAEFMGMPLQDITEKYPDVYFGSVIASDLATERNFIRFFPRQYQALYLEGLIAGALTETGNIGIVSAFPSVQVIRRQNGFILGVQDAAEMLGKDVNIYVKYVGDWFLPPEERSIAETLISQYDVDVITQQTDSGSPLDVAQEQGIWFIGKDMDIVGEYGWSDTDTVAVSFDTRWEVLYDHMIQDQLSGNQNPETVLYLGMNDSIVLADGTEVATVDIMNDGKIGTEAISPAARPSIPDEIVALVEQRRNEMIAGEWDPFTEHAFISNGTGLEMDGTPIPAAGTEVKAAGEVPTSEWLLSLFNFDLQGVEILE
jgi:basic membrane protein A and related proteins